MLEKRAFSYSNPLDSLPMVGHEILLCNMKHFNQAIRLVEMLRKKGVTNAPLFLRFNDGRIALVGHFKVF